MRPAARTLEQERSGHDVTEREALDSQPVQVRSGETPGSSVAMPPASVERPGSKRGGATGRSAALSEVCSVVKDSRVERGTGGAEPVWIWRRPWKAPVNLERVPRDTPA